MKWTGPALACLLVILSCSNTEHGSPGELEQLRATLSTLQLPMEHEEAEAVFTRVCQTCHGYRASGSESGPPLVHHVYRPSHHGDAAFQLAVIRGVRAHHWGYGDMPPASAVTPEEATAITSYVRWLQRQVGIGE